MTNWRPVLANRSSDFLFSSSSCSALKRFAWSTTGSRPRSGKVWAAAGVASATSASHRTARRRVTLAGVEVDRGCGLGSYRGFERHLGLGAVEDFGADRV